MNIYQKTLVLGILILFIGSCVAPSSGVFLVNKPSILNSNGTTLYVGGSGSGNYSNIQDAIDDASDGDTVFVFDNSSPYYENIVVNKSINLIGEDRDTTVIDGSNYGCVVKITADLVAIYEFTIQNSGSNWSNSGIFIISNYNTIIANIIKYNNDNGIYLGKNSNNNTITGNNIKYNNRNGIYLINSNDNNIKANNITNNQGFYGIRLDSSNSNIISDNNILNNYDGILVYNQSKNNIIQNNTIWSSYYGMTLERSSENTIVSNTIYENHFCLWIDYHSNNNIIINNNLSLNDGYGIKVQSSHNNIIKGNNISYNGYGILLDSASKTNITRNNIFNNNNNGIGLFSSSGENTILSNNITSNDKVGIYLSFSDNNNLKDNFITTNKDDGIELYNSGNNTILRNFISSNKDEAIDIWSSSDHNIIYHNNFINNMQSAYDECENIWDDGKYGNYWSDYKEQYPDARRLWLKGIWDTPYEITGGNNKDNYPLINQWPNLKSKTIPRNTASNSYYLLRFLGRLPLL